MFSSLFKISIVPFLWMIIISLVLIRSTKSMAASDSKDLEEYYDNPNGYLDSDINAIPSLEKQIVEMKRGCIKRSGSCDKRPKDCCMNSVCRCGLWGGDCRCQRMGLFRRFG